MNWFERYGIPGAFFWGLVIGWIWAISPCLLIGNENSLRNIGVIAGVTFIPVGYILSVFQQCLYLWHPRIGMHRSALRKANKEKELTSAVDEPSIEAYTLILTIKTNKLENNDSLKRYEWLRGWIAKRMDVIAIDFSLIIATPLALITAFACCLLISTVQIEFMRFLLVGITAFVICLIIWWNKKLLRKQVIIVIKDCYERFL